MVQIQSFESQYTHYGTNVAAMAQNPDTNVAMTTVTPDKEVGPDVPDDVSVHKLEATLPSQDAQPGVQKIEAVTLAWTKYSLAALLFKYVCPEYAIEVDTFTNSNLCYSIWLIFLTNGFRGSILASLNPYVISDFQSHSLLTVINIVSSAMTSAVYIPMAKLLDLWGRAEGFLLMVGFSTLGVILMASSHNLATYCAAEVKLGPILNQARSADGVLNTRYSTRLVSQVLSIPWLSSQLMRRA